jgi:multidrug resistance efflux pump
MRSSHLSVSLSAGVAALAAIFAGALIWLMLSDPVSVADAIETGEIAPLVAQLASVIYQALLNLLDYL